MSLRYITGESISDEERRNCSRCDHYRGYLCAEHREPSYESLLKEIDHLRDIVDRLPKTADGVPIVPGMAVYLLKTWDRTIIVSGHVEHIVRYSDGDCWLQVGTTTSEITKRPNECYSTREAAAAAKERIE